MRILLTFVLFLNLISAFAQNNDSLVYEFGDKLKVYKDLNSQTFRIKKNDKKVVFKKLKFIEHLGEYLQVLDKNNIPFYINNKGKKKKKVNITLALCGTVPNYVYEIVEKNESYYLTENENFYDYEDKIPPKIIDSIEVKGIDKINFPNNENKIEFDENSFVFNHTEVFPHALIIQKGKKQGVLYQGKLTFYDEVTYDSGLLKVKINNQLGYYGITKARYKELETFIFGLAKFKTFDNRSGYVDSNGKEYYK
ncbi:hypothetical protein [Bizionia paragorgiae]|uniref:WG containing repeat-containing protein n=1 Tax=Bizionia paragorgiae TaxID=283786 RepID=A0A1H4CIH0_BIZPA|nr:hypothetical protein [Bizionia paragorgiae]SEA60138.1 hypothetical protein SAMN04487990_12010 [Bizionia paragorgiae]